MLSSEPSGSYTYRYFSPEFADELVLIFRTMFPHQDVADEPYTCVVRKLDDRAAEDQALAVLLSDGAGALNPKTESKWQGLSAHSKIEALRRIEGTAFFKTLRADFITWFYSNPNVWAGFGYEGPSNDKGGYVQRGFNDIEWINRGES